MKKAPRILFVSHAASRNGATILLLHLLRWLREHSNYRLEVLVNGSGPLVDEFRAICETRVWRSPGVLLSACCRGRNSSWHSRIDSQFLKWWMAGRYYDLVYLNTSAVWAYVAELAKRSGSLLWHIHELEYVLRLSIGEHGIKTLFPRTTRFVAVSQSVRETLVQRFNVPLEKVDVVNGFVERPKRSAEEALACRSRLRRQLGWPADAFVVGGCGALGWRKGTDLFVQIARAVYERGDNHPVRFLWVGGTESVDESLRFEHDVRAFALTGLCKLVPSTADVLDYYHAMDVFALTSREDPFPLVMLEAGACNLPVICFEKSGGGPEFVSTDAGLVVPYLDMTSFARQIECLRGDSELRRSLGAKTAEKVHRHHLIDSQGPKLLASIELCLSGFRP